MFFLVLFLLLTNSIQGWYQDSVINGKIVEKGERSCSPSYLVLKQIFDKYQRPFTVLDLGAAQGFFSFMTAHEYNATCVMVEGDYDYQNHTSKLLDLCKQNTKLDNIIFLKQLIDLNFLKNLADCEHFDVTLALNFVHHSGLDWQKTIDLIVELGDNLILENPPADELEIPNFEKDKRASIDKYMEQIGAKLIGGTERFNKSISKSKIWWLHKPKKYLRKRHIYWPPPSYINHQDRNRSHIIHSNFAKKELIKKQEDHEIKTPWIAGINLVTFLALNGAYPTRDLVKKEINNLKSDQMSDWGIANMVISGKTIYLIDQKDFSRQDPYENINQFLDQNQCLDSKTYWEINQSCLKDFGVRSALENKKTTRSKNIGRLY
jgi:hypothetical protein